MTDMELAALPAPLTAAAFTRRLDVFEDGDPIEIDYSLGESSVIKQDKGVLKVVDGTRFLRRPDGDVQLPAIPKPGAAPVHYHGIRLRRGNSRPRQPSAEGGTHSVDNPILTLLEDLRATTKLTAERLTRLEAATGPNAPDASALNVTQPPRTTSSPDTNTHAARTTLPAPPADAYSFLTDPLRTTHDVPIAAAAPAQPRTFDVDDAAAWPTHDGPERAFMLATLRKAYLEGIPQAGRAAATNIIARIDELLQDRAACDPSEAPAGYFVRKLARCIFDLRVNAAESRGQVLKGWFARQLEAGNPPEAFARLLAEAPPPAKAPPPPQSSTAKAPVASTQPAPAYPQVSLPNLPPPLYQPRGGGTSFRGGRRN